MNDTSKHQSILSLISDFAGDVEGATILDLGSDVRGSTVSTLHSVLGLKEAIGVNPAIKDPIEESGYRVVNEDARNLPFQDNTFDLIVSVAAFEHFYDLGVTLKEAFRVLKSDGMLLTVFGPIWSGCWGHHLWLSHRGELFSYQNTEIPPWGHILLSPEDMRTHLENQFDDNELVESALEFIYESPEQNRMFFDEYEEIFSNSPFEVIHFSGGTNRSKRGQYDPATFGRALEDLKSSHPKRRGFEHDSIRVALRK